MSVLTFDTYSYIKSLTKAGVPEDQPEAHATALKESQKAHLEVLATKGYLENLRRDITIQINRSVLTLGSLIIGVAGIVIAYLELRGGN